jgi:YesN/AraC family two-component response regulator
MYIDFDGIRADELFSRFDISVVNRLFDGFDGVIPMWQQSLLRADEQTIDIIAESMLLYGFSNLPPKTSAQNSIVNKMLDMCQKNFCDSDFSLNYIADKLCYNPKYLSHLFKQKMNVGFSEYLRTLRINYAITLFDNGLDSIKNVALLSGFSDPLYFSSVFKKTVGKSPKDYICAS